MNKRNINQPELLAPAGDLSRLKTALLYGADAIYIGGESFGMRSSPSNFSIDDMKIGAEIAHAKGVKVFLTLNTIPNNDEADELPAYLKSLEGTGIDAVIVADIGVLALVKEILPDMEVHISTQAGIMNHRTANAFYKMGAKRVVLARELSLTEIAVIREHTPKELEIEAFVHGSMCMAFSGRCLLSNYMVGRDANRGECAQPCRWKYALVDTRKSDELMPIVEDESGTYILNAKDLCMINYIRELEAAGISSFKIEGRAKSDFYVAVVVGAYRMAMDFWKENPEAEVLPSWIVEELSTVSHRAYSTGFYFGKPSDGQYYENSGYTRESDVVAIIESCEGERIFCEQRNKFAAGDEIEILPPGKKPITIIAEDIQNEAGETIENTPHAQMKFSLKSDIVVPIGSMIRKMI